MLKYLEIAIATLQTSMDIKKSFHGAGEIEKSVKMLGLKP